MSAREDAFDGKAKKIEYIKSNFQKLTNKQLMHELNISHNSFYRLIKEIGIKKNISQIPEITAMICELFASGNSIRDISKIVKKHEASVSKTISEVWLYKMKSENTITLVVESKINYEHTFKKTNDKSSNNIKKGSGNIGFLAS